MKFKAICQLSVVSSMAGNPNLVSQVREIEIFCEDCELAAPLAFCRGFGPRFRVHQFKSAWPARVPLETTCECLPRSKRRFNLQFDRSETSSTATD